MLGSMGVPETRLFLIPGSGVDTAQLLPLPEPDTPITMAYTGRLLEIKGLRTLADAQEQLARAGTPVRLLIAGEPDPSNPAPISADEIERWRRRDGITLLGHVKDIREVWAAAHIAVQASYGGEGLPKSLLEAAACGRPIVATDVPGCRQIARDGVNAVLVPPRDASALSSAIARLAGDAGLRSRFGAASRKIVEQEFSAERIGREIVALYGVLLARGEAKDMAGARS
jgi:glycosyltransferase involved in cell wall biosynthesis